MIRKFKKAVTDSEAEVRYAPGKDGVNNLMTIYRAFTGKSYEEIEREFRGKGYGDFKLAVGEACADALEPIQKQYNCLMSDRSYMENVLANNSDYAAYLARKMLSKVYRKVGFLAKNK
jgi:tryptophanyl-tRNA synthetase